MSNTKITLFGLNELDAEELAEGVRELEVVRPTIAEGKLAEPATIAAIVTITTASITALGIWLAKGRRKHLLEQTVEIMHSDGRVERKTLKVESSTEEGVNAEVIVQLKSWLE